MPLGGGGLDTYDGNFTGVDANNEGAVTGSINVGDISRAALFVTSSGSTHVVTLQLSPDGEKWFDTEHTVTGSGSSHAAICIGQEVRAKVTTPEGSPLLIEIDLVSR